HLVHFHIASDLRLLYAGRNPGAAQLFNRAMAAATVGAVSNTRGAAPLLVAILVTSNTSATLGARPQITRRPPVSSNWARKRRNGRKAGVRMEVTCSRFSTTFWAFASVTLVTSSWPSASTTLS